VIHPIAVVAKQCNEYVPQQKFLIKSVGSPLLGTRHYNSTLYIDSEALSATMHSVTDRQTDERMDNVI